MKKLEKAWIFIWAGAMLLFGLLTVNGLRFQYGDTVRTIVRGVDDLNLGSDLTGGLELALQPESGLPAEQQLLDTILAGGFNDDLLTIANQKATQLKRDRLALYERMEDLKSRENETDAVVNLAKSWKTADYQQKKSVAMLLIHKILICEDGSTKIVWNL